jgi:hypothetical protein
MKNRMFWSVILALGCAVSSFGQDNDPGEKDTLYISSVEVDAGEKAIVSIDFFNDEELAALTIPIAWSSADISLDSVSFVGGRIDYIGTKPLTIYNDIQKVVFGAIVFLEANIQPGAGLMATLHFDIPPGTPDQFVYLDTTTHPPAELLFTNVNSTNFTPIVLPGKITIGEPPVAPHIELSPTSMVFEGIIGHSNPSPQTLSIDNSGEGALIWTATNNSGWLSVNPSNGTAPSLSSIIVDMAGLAEGSYYDTVVVSCPEADNDPQYLPVTLSIIQLPPIIEFDPPEFNVSGVQDGANPDDRYLDIWTDVPGSELNWTVSNSSGWLSLTPSSGSPPDQVTLQFDITGLSFGMYYDTVVISDPTATNSPQHVPVTLQIVSDLPVLELDPPVLYVNTTVGENALPQSVTVNNAGEGVLTFEAEEHTTWITTINPSSGTAPQSLIINFATLPHGIGDYVDTITITSPEAINSPQQLVVHFHISENPANLVVVPNNISFLYYECWQGPGALPPIKTFQVLNTGGDEMNWWLTYNSEWLLVETESGTGNDIIMTTIDAADLALGSYYDTITVYSNESVISPRKLPVTLNIIEGTEPPEIKLVSTIYNIPAQEVYGTPLVELGAVAQITNLKPGCLDFWIEDDIPWLTFIDSSGTAPATPKVRLDIGVYTYGEYPDSFMVYSAEATNSPVTGYLNLQVFRLHGDNDWNNLIDLGDVVYLINYVFKHGPEPQPHPLVGDCNCNDFVGVDDIVVMINYIFKHGTAPCGNPKK